MCNFRFILVFSALPFSLLFSCASDNKDKKEKQTNSVSVDSSGWPPKPWPEGMVWVKGTQFTMGTDENEAYIHEKPAHQVKVDGYWIDATEVTNAQFSKFISATGYITVAERTPDWEELRKQLPPGTPKPPADQLIPGSLVFSPPSQPVELNDISQWWAWKPGASWKHPEGPGSSIDGKDNYPVVHVAYEDALAYCSWAGKRLPTEAEWELASRGGREKQRYEWGNEFKPGGKFMANTYQGHFPDKSIAEDGFTGTAPVKSFPPNHYGIYDMTGNVWELTSDWYDVGYYTTLAASGVAVNPRGPDKPYDPNEPFSRKHVTRGGSFLCTESYCCNYRPSARQGTAFDSGMSHIGFRCVISQDSWEKQKRLTKQ